MALGMKSWTGLVLAGCAALALRYLPPSEVQVSRGQVELQESRRASALSDDAARANAMLQRLRIAAEVIPATLAGTGEVVFSAAEGSDPADVERARGEALAEAAALPGGVALGAFYVSWRDHGHPGAPSSYIGDVEYYYGERDGRAYCAAVHPVWRRRTGEPFSLYGVTYDRTTALGLCALVARHGLPGPAGQAWIDGGGSAMTTASVPSDPASYTFSTRLGRSFERVGPLGLPQAGPLAGGFRTTPVERCLSGRADGCAAVLMRPSNPWASRFWRYGAEWAPLFAATPLSAVQEQSIFEPADRHVAADLVAEFGADRFRQWWTADGDPAQAFEEAFGVDPGEWYLARISQLVTIRAAGPGVTPNGLAGTVLLLALGGVVAGAWARSRRVA